MKVKTVLPIVILLCLLPGAASTTINPVNDYIAAADSIRASHGDSLLAEYITRRAILGGAAVGTLLDQAFDLDGEARKDKIGFAEHIARLHRDCTGSAIPLDIVNRCRSWTGTELKIRAQARDLDRRATMARDRHQLDQAVQLYHQARALYEQIEDTRSVAILWGSLGVTHWYRNDMDAVEESYLHALPLRQEVEDRILEGRTLNGLGSVSFQKGSYEKAVSYYDRAIDLRKQTEDVEGLITSYIYRGATYTRLGRLMDARISFQSALPFLDRAGSPRQKIETYNNLGGLYQDMGNLKSALESYHTAIDHAINAGESMMEASTRINLADDLRVVGRYHEALLQLEHAQRALEREPAPVQTALLHRTRGTLYMFMGELDKAREDLLIFLKSTESFQDRAYHVEALITLGYLYRELGAYSNGLASVMKALQIAKQNNYERLFRESLVIAADLQSFLGRYDNALQNIDRALQIDRREDYQEKIIEDLLYLANIKSYMGKFDEGRAVFAEMRELTADMGRADLEWVVLFGMGHTYEKENPDSAFVYYEKAFARIEEVGAELGGQEIHSGFFSNERRRYFEEVMRFYASQAKAGEDLTWSGRAFQTIERAKSRGLLDLIEQNVKENVSPEEEMLLDSLYALKSRPGQKTDEQRRLESRYMKLRRQRVEQQLGDVGSMENIARIDVVQDLLPKKTVLLEYALGDTVSFLWCITDRDLRLFELPKRKILRQKVTRLRDAVARPGAGDASLKRLSRNLYSILLEPAERFLEKQKTLILIPDGILFELPFEILLRTNPEEHQQWGEMDWVGKKFETTYFPSASIMVELQTAEIPESFDRDLVAVGFPDYTSLEVKAELMASSIVPLPYTKREVEAIGALLPAERSVVMVGKQASESALKTQVQGGTQRILHLATHGYADPVEPIVSSVLLCRDDQSSDDGYLHTLEILSMPIQSNLVVLSACESGRGRLSRGEGVVGLSRAFFAAGAKSVIATLWNVSDNSTSQLMERFYTTLINEKATARMALKDARCTLLDEETFAHPFYWSPFILIGRPDMPWNN